MPNTDIHIVEQFATRNKQPADLDFTFGLGLEVGYPSPLPPNPEKEVEDETISPNVEGVATQDMGHQMEDAANGDYPSMKYKTTTLTEITIKLTVHMEEIWIQNQREEF